MPHAPCGFQVAIATDARLCSLSFQADGFEAACSGFLNPVPPGRSLDIAEDPQLFDGPITLIVDSTGLQVHSGRAWMQQKHGIKKARKAWRKLHIGFDPDSGQIVTSTLTTEHVDDEAALPELCATRHPINRFLSDCAYDGAPSEAVIREAFGSDVEIVIPPPCDATRGDSPMRNAHIAQIANHGRIAWQKTTGYTERSRVEAQIGRSNQSLVAGFTAAIWRPNKPKQPSA